MREKKNSRKNPKELDILLQEESDVRYLEEIEPRNKGKKKKISNKEFIVVTYFFVLLFLGMMGYMIYFNAVKSKDIINSPYNVRLNYMADRVVRGKILDRNGNVLAETLIEDDGTETRHYPHNDLYAHVVGYDSNGKSGIELSENYNLLTSSAPILEKITKEFQEEKNIGDNVVTTLDNDIQQAAYNALGEYKGAVVVMEASTGKILAMVSKPTFNPNSIISDWEWLINDENSALLNRATQGSYAPGSVFKIVTALEYIRQNNSYEEYHYLCNGEITDAGTTIHCANNRAHGDEDIASSLAYSCNASFANMGLELNVTSWKKTAKELLFNAKLPSPLPCTQSKFQLEKDSPLSEVMMTAMGQGKTQVSPYHMALITSAIANGGILMKPYLVDYVESYKGNVIDKNLPKKYATLMSSKEASQLKEYLCDVVEYGTGGALNNDTYSVAGKTGTAEYSSDKEKAHSWFVGFSNVDNPELIISVVVESADQSGMSAVSVAKRILDMYYY